MLRVFNLGWIANILKRIQSLIVVIKQPDTPAVQARKRRLTFREIFIWFFSVIFILRIKCIFCGLTISMELKMQPEVFRCKSLITDHTHYWFWLAWLFYHFWFNERRSGTHTGLVLDEITLTKLLRNGVVLRRRRKLTVGLVGYWMVVIIGKVDRGRRITIGPY